MYFDEYNWGSKTPMINNADVENSGGDGSGGGGDSTCESFSTIRESFAKSPFPLKTSMAFESFTPVSILK